MVVEFTSHFSKVSLFTATAAAVMQFHSSTTVAERKGTLTKFFTKPPQVKDAHSDTSDVKLNC